ncbi:MAG: PD40 domain-containing protein [Acidobacteria bacterium]|nr:PD40 domain-containing protein [Acidobacteriota bacterium]
MSGIHTPRPIISFGPFEADLQTQEVKKQGIRLHLPGQSFQILKMLLERPGELVTREELQEALWPNETFVDYGHGVNAAVNRLRDALGDSADNPRLIETLPRRGYRFIGTIAQPEESTAPAEAGDDRRDRLRWLRVGAGILVVVAACALAVWFVPRVAPGFSLPKITTLAAVPVTAYPGEELCLAFSPDGSQIVFAWNGDPELGPQGFDLYVKVLGSEDLLRLTHHPSAAICPAWSPDGSQIAFHRLSGADTGLYVVPALGGPQRKLRSTNITSENHTYISWSPDGKWIAHVDNQRLFLLSTETLESRQIPHTPECLSEGMPAFSHSGRELAYFCTQNTQNLTRGLYTVSTSGGTPKLVTTIVCGWPPRPPAWAAGDQKLVFSNTHFGESSDLYDVTLADGSIRKLPTEGGAFGPAISAKGDKLAYVKPISGDHGQIWRSDLLNPGSSGVRLMASTYQQRSQQFSPDGKHIAFESTRGGIREVWMSDADGTQLVQVSNFKDPRTGSPHWSPDSQKIVFDTRHSELAELYVADISERLPRKLITNITDIFLPTWSHDGKWIYFVSGEPTSRGIYRCPASGGDAVLLLTLPPQSSLLGPLAESFDGETLYFSRAVGGYRWELDMVSTQRPVKITAVEGLPTVDYNVWAIAPGGMYFVDFDANKSIRYFDFSTKQVRPILDVGRAVDGGLAVSPDGRWVLYVQKEDYNEDIMLVDNFQ